jgi:hypothetical protein
MSDNPTATLARPRLHFCLAHHPNSTELICTRLDQHPAHCCDEIAEEAWDQRGRTVDCDHDHSEEKGLARP